MRRTIIARPAPLVDEHQLRTARRLITVGVILTAGLIVALGAFVRAASSYTPDGGYPRSGHADAPNPDVGPRRGIVGFRPSPCRTGPRFDAYACPLASYRDEYTHAELAALIGRTFPEDPTHWVLIGHCESTTPRRPEGLDRLAVGQSKDRANPWRGGERGLFEVHAIHATDHGESHPEGTPPAPGSLIGRYGFTWDDMFDAGPNLVIARALYDAAGYTAWICRAPWTNGRP